MEQQTLIYTNTTNPISRFYSNPPPLIQNQEILINESCNEEKGSSFSSLTRNPSPTFVRTESVPSLMAKSQNQEILINGSSNEEKGPSFFSLTRDPSPGIVRTGSMPSLMAKSQNEEILINGSSNEEKGSSFSSLARGPSPGFVRIGSVPSLMNKNDEEEDVEDEESEFKMGRLIRQASLNSSNMSTPQKTIKARKLSLRRYMSLKPETNQEKIIDMRKVESMKERSRSRSRSSMKAGGGGDGDGDGGDAPGMAGGWDDKGLSENMKLQIKFWARAVAVNVHEEC